MARLSRPRPAAGRGGGDGAEDAHADRPLQRAPGMARPRHAALDAAVAAAAAYGWPADLPDDAILAPLFALNQQRAAAGR